MVIIKCVATKGNSCREKSGVSKIWCFMRVQKELTPCIIYSNKSI